jgi:hypothetical protein
VKNISRSTRRLLRGLTAFWVTNLFQHQSLIFLPNCWNARHFHVSSNSQREIHTWLLELNMLELNNDQRRELTTFRQRSRPCAPLPRASRLIAAPWSGLEPKAPITFSAVFTTKPPARDGSGRSAFAVTRPSVERLNSTPVAPRRRRVFRCSIRGCEKRPLLAVRLIRDRVEPR